MVCPIPQGDPNNTTITFMVLSSWPYSHSVSLAVFVKCRLSAGWRPTLRSSQPTYCSDIYCNNGFYLSSYACIQGLEFTDYHSCILYFRCNVYEQAACCASASLIISDSIIPWRHVDSRKTCRPITTKFRKMCQVIITLHGDTVIRWFCVQQQQQQQQQQSLFNFVVVRPNSTIGSTIKDTK